MKKRGHETTKLKGRNAPPVARHRGPTAADLQKRLDQRTRELAEARKHLAEALEQKTASITFHDGSPLTAHDVAFSLKVLKDKGHPIAQQLLRDLAGAEASDDATMVVRFAPNRARESRFRSRGGSQIQPEAAAAQVGQPWFWTLAFGQHEDSTPTHGYEPTREAAMAAFAKSWRRE
jgi:hypothetical protein